MLAALPTIKFPDQNNVAKINNKYASTFLLRTNYENLKEL